MNNELLSILRLYRTENIGVVSFFYLINKFKSAEEAIENIGFLEAKWNKKVNLIEKDNIFKEIEQTENFGAKIITYVDENFPNSLKFNNVTPLITVLGNEKLLKSNMISIVGTRYPSINGIKFCSSITKSLGESGFTVVSGLAKGIDIEAHKSSINTGTIAVLAGGIDSIYPAENTKYYHEIKEKGLIISDRQFGTCPSSKLFPKRNNIIAALGCATVVIESMAESGALITAEQAKKMKKPVFTVPGHPYDEKYAGNNYLLKNGGFILTNIDDILNNLNNISESSCDLVVFEDFSEQDQNNVFKYLSYAPTNINELSEISGVSINKVLSVLVEMEILGIIKINPNNTVYKI